MTIQRTDQRTIDFRTLETLKFDPDNPRLPPDLPRTDAAILEWMLEDASILDLMGAIGAQGYFPGEPVLGVQGNGSFVVVEGNRRLAAAKLLAEPGMAPTRKASVRRVAQDAEFHPTELPTLSFDHRDNILDYLGYRHVTGVKEWEPLAKARYVRQLVERAERTGETPDLGEIARKIGSRRDYVQRLLASLRLFDRAAAKDFYGLPGVDEEAIDFSVLSTAVGYEAIAHFIGLRAPTDTDSEANDENLKDLIDWAFRELPTGGTALGESRNLQTLAEVVKSDRALEALRQGASLDQAAEFSEEARVAYRGAMRDSRHSLERARDYVHRLNEATAADVELADDVLGIARFVRTGIAERFTEKDEA